MSNRIETPLQSLFQAPLSIAQERVWFLTELNTGYALYNEPTAVGLEGALDVLALQNALAAIIERHQTLRTTLVLTNETVPVQVIKERGPIDLPIINLSGGPTQKREQELQRALMEIATTPFDLIHDFPWRATLLKLAAAQHVLLFVAHHIFFDGSSKDILWRELATLYQACSQGKPDPLPALPMQYADYVAWQRQWLKSEALKTHLTYWKDRLSDLRALELPTDRPRPAIQTFQGAQEHFLFGHSLSAELKALSRETGVSLFNILLAAFKTLLCRYTGQEDIALGFAVAGRHRAELDGLIGCFENTLVLRTDLSGNPTFSELLDRVHRVTSEAVEHADIPFATILKELDPDRDLTRSPLFQVTFAHHRVTNYARELAGIGISSVTVSSGTTKFDLTLHTSDTPEGLNAKLEYNTDLFDAVTIKRMVGHFETLLQSIATNPAQRIFNLPILTNTEKHQLLVEWNDTKKDCPKDKCFHELFETQVQRCPESVAVSFEDQELTYRQLNSRANQLAHYLRQLGVGPEFLVGVCAKRSLDMIVGLLGILKAGGAYVPLDPAYPKERLEFVLQDAQVSILLTQQQLLDALPTAPGTRRLCLDADRLKFAEQIDANPDHRTSSKNLAYVIYTSGSTGKPKGVAIEHFSVTTFLSWAHTVFTREDLTGVLASTSICFDLSVFELFAPLTCGGKVILAENALALPGLIASSEVTLVNTVPSAIAELVQVNGIPPSVRIINLAGEPLSTTLVQQIYQKSSAKRVYDLYGPSEDTTYSTCALRTQKGPKTIGRPIFNTQVYILDGYMNPVPIGIPGQLYIGGDGLARGYFNRPDLTAQKFIADPFSANPGGRLYSTGDMARYMPDGNIEFLGRIDHQIKLRGFRIELGEIEAVLCQYPAVQEAVAVVREDTPGTRCLVAYITRKKRELIPPVELRRYLERKLPAYMVPSVFVILEALPLTPNGKVDRRALPIPEQRTNLAEPAVAPRTPTEEIITKIWANLFKVDRVGVHDNFFELGGHSLLALRLVNEINKKFDKKLPLTAVFQAPTVEQLANLVAHGSTLATWSSLYEIQPHGSKPPFFWIHGEDSDPFLARYLESDQPLYGVRHQSEDGRAALYTTVADITKHYLSEMLSVKPQGPYFLGGYCFGSVIAFEIAHQLRRLNKEVRLLVMLEPDNPIISQSTAHSAQSTSAFSNSGTSLIDRISRYWAKLRSLKPKEKARYIVERATGKIRHQGGIVAAANKTITRAAYRTYLALGYPIPPSFRSRYILDIYDKAMANYAPEVYPGRLTMFRTAYSCDAGVWKRLAGEGLDLHEISGDHTAILRDPYVRQWAETLSIEIVRAQIANGTQKQSAA